MNKFYEIYFSPTGGTERVSKILTAHLSGSLGAEPESVNLLQILRDGGSLPVFAAEDVCLISVPSFAGRVPLPAVSVLEQLKGNGARAVLNVVFGNRAIDDTLLELRDVLEAAGFVCAAAMETVAEHSMFRQFGAGRPDAEDEAELKDFACQTAELLQGGDSAGSLEGQLQVPGNYPYRERKPVSAIPEGGEGCSGCGICVKACPVHAIPADAPKTVNRELCFGCMRCVSVCPAGGRDISGAVREKMLPIMSQNCSGRKINQLYMDRNPAN